MNNRNQTGFTLLELMIVIAIVGILATVALPAYQDYTIRAKMAEPMAVLAEAKASVAEYFAATGSLPADADQAGIETDVSSTLVDSLAVDSDGNLTLTLTEDDSLGDAAGQSILLNVVSSDGGRLEYECRPGPGMAAKYLPASCRG